MHHLKKLSWVIPFLLVAAVALPPAATISGLPVYNIVDYGARGDNNPINAAVNTAAMKAAIAAAANFGSPAIVYIPPSAGFVVNNGQIMITTPNTVIKGDCTMGANSDKGPVSMLVGKGRGHTIAISPNATGCHVQGINFGAVSAFEQTNPDAYLMVSASNATLRDLYFYEPSIGISIQLPTNLDGEFWIEHVLIQGEIETAGILANAGNAAVNFFNIIMYGDDPQPPYGIVVTSCGKLILDHSDLINCGNCLAIVPGLGGVQGQHANALFLSNTCFDGGNGQGACYICPTNGAYVLTGMINNCWASTARNGLTADGQYPTNGFTLDGSQSKPLLATLKSIQGINFTNCTSKGFINHCGWYVKGVNSFSMVNCTAGACFNGIQIAPGCVDYVLNGNKCGDYVPPAGNLPSGGNQAFGILIEPNDYGICTNNMLRGNRLGGLLNQFPNPHQVVGSNVQ